MRKEEKKPIMGRPRARAHGVEAIVSAHQWPSVIAVWCLENYYRVSKVQCRPRTTSVGRHSTVAGLRNVEMKIGRGFWKWAQHTINAQTDQYAAAHLLAGDEIRQHLETAAVYITVGVDGTCRGGAPSSRRPRADPAAHASGFRQCRAVLRSSNCSHRAVALREPGSRRRRAVAVRSRRPPRTAAGTAR
ncbi:hypothetical protein EVAR_57088_1 [Eumeta japonica]|uniref:Uncharacterized protein n=1 Tax=Eumeta variegata TaxID=151549 RepID=A0A4C1Z731_EUMVA|nr:hypothetical protein EVAR_57088_1 [Eumeta japonica]